MEGNAKKKGGSLNPLLIIFSVIVLCTIATWFVTPGAFERVVENGRTLVVAGSYHSVPRTPLSIFDIFRAIPNGLEGAAGMMMMMLIVSGSVEVYSRTGAINMGMAGILKAADRFGSTAVLIIIMFVFAVLGGILGWSEQIIPFVPLVVSLCLALGYDSLVGIAVCGFVDMIGFSVSPFAYATVGISQTVAELPLFSGWQFRMMVLVIMQAVCWIWILRYAKKVKKDPDKSLMKGIDVSSLKRDYSEFENKKMTTPQVLALIILGVSFAVSIYGLLNLGWSTNELAAAFLFGSILAAIVNRLTPTDTVNGLVEGAKGGIMGALIIGVARGIQWVMTEGGLIDPVTNGLANALNGLPEYVTIIGIIFIVVLLNGLIASGSGKAMALMPVLIPLADMLGITRQAAILAYQFGDGISNTFWFTNGTMLIYFALGKVPLRKWYKFIIPLEFILYGIAIVLAIISVKIGYGPF